MEIGINSMIHDSYESLNVPATGGKVVETKIRNFPELAGAFVSVARQTNS